MPEFFTIKDVDRKFFRENLSEFLPDKIIDIHTHIWKKELLAPVNPKMQDKIVSWPSKVAETCPVEDLLECYRQAFPGKEVTPMVFSQLPNGNDINALNNYVSVSASANNLPALIFSSPEWSAEELGSKLNSGNFLGIKSYLTMTDSNIPANEITVFDFFPRHQLEMMNARKGIVMLHLPRSRRLKDPENLKNLLELDRDYPDLQVIVAHVGRAYCNPDAGNAFEILRQTKNLRFDFSANANPWIFEQLIETAGPERIHFGTDLPILMMRARRICENGFYVNLVPERLYGELNDPHMREVSGEEAEKLTFFVYEEIAAFKRAAETAGLSKDDIDKIFYRNSRNVLKNAGWQEKL